jgi:hypothetical protein
VDRGECDCVVQQPGHRLDERRAEQFHVNELVDQVDVHVARIIQFLLHQRLQLVRVYAVATDAVLRMRPDVGQHGLLPRKTDGFKANPLPLFAALLRAEASQAQVAQPLDQAA